MTSSSETEDEVEAEFAVGDRVVCRWERKFYLTVIEVFVADDGGYRYGCQVLGRVKPCYYDERWLERESRERTSARVRQEKLLVPSEGEAEREDERSAMGEMFPPKLRDPDAAIEPPAHFLGAKFKESLKRLEHQNPPAYRFVVRIRDDGPSRAELVFSASSNAHLYKRDGFLMYIKLNGRAAAPTHVVLSPHFNLSIGSRKDRSDLIFPSVIDELLELHHETSGSWSIKLADGGLELKASAPDSFYAMLYSRLCAVDVSG